MATTIIMAEKHWELSVVGKKIMISKKPVLDIDIRTIDFIRQKVMHFLRLCVILCK